MTSTTICWRWKASIGRELVLAGLGFSEHDIAAQAELDKQLLDDQTELERSRSITDRTIRR